jgi:hypothetical protein
MNLLKLFKTKKRTVFDKVRGTVEPMIVRKYRELAKEHRCAPTIKTSDDKIIQIYEKVLSSFAHTASTMGEVIPAKNLNYIAFKFLQVYETSGEKFMWEHLDYEIMKYRMHGLRPEYKQGEISLF